MPPRISHVAINADDLEKSLDFYEAVFGWTFTESYPGFFRMEAPHTFQIVAVQQRRDLLPSGPTIAPRQIVSPPSHPHETLENVE